LIKDHINRIILIMDESVRGDLLGINGGRQEVTPFIEGNSEQIFNYGIASAGSNCSANSNIIVQSGVTPGQIEDGGQAVFTNPSLFQYAQAAGYKTIFIEGQNLSSEPANFMTRYDFEFIDEYRQTVYETPGVVVSQYASSERSRWPFVDREIARQLSELARSEERIFVYVVKHGSHFPYEGSYPVEQRQFNPTLSTSLSQSLEAENFDELENVERRTNSYLNALRWSVDGFFEKLLPEVINQDVLIIYTADHGQSLLENGLKLTHCSAWNAPAVQANVPFLVLAGGRNFEDFAALSQDSLRSNKNRVSHFQIVPTILTLAGFDPSAVRREHGRNLFEELDQPRFFYTGRVWGNVTRNAFDN